jgi:hypothetical protein
MGFRRVRDFALSQTAHCTIRPRTSSRPIYAAFSQFQIWTVGDLSNIVTPPINAGEREPWQTNCGHCVLIRGVAHGARCCAVRWLGCLQLRARF